MPFDDSTRGRLQSFVGAARDLLAGEFAWQLQQTYGMDPVSGEVAGLDRLGHLDDQRLETARILREILDHYLGAAANPPVQARRHALDRIVREQAFTVLNRLAALRLMEARGILLESVARGYQSTAFQLYQRVAGSALGETGDAYRVFLFSLFDLFAADLPALFDRHSPFGRLFPREASFLQLLDLLNADDLEPLWGEDETIGWIYQYFNSTEERRRMRKESGAPRNSRELAVRNQFFTPRYVVEFLVDNALARQWIDMSAGRSSLLDQCRFLVRRPDEVFLGRMSAEEGSGPAAIAGALIDRDFARLPDFGDPETGAQAMIDFAHCVDACHRFPDQGQLWGDYAQRLQPILREQRFAEATTQELWDGLFLECRSDRAGGNGEIYGEPWFRAACEEILRRLKEPKPKTSLNRYRPLRDPRTLKLLDPACGSMHFGLYAFDVFHRIYRDAWAWEAEGWPGGHRAEAPGLKPLHEVYADEAAFLRDLPRLILEHNIYGVDIDPRAAQIASLALWLRAQRAWNDDGVRREARPAVGRGHVVAAVAPPAELDLRRELMAGMDELDAELFERTLFLLKDLPELGVLLCAEHDVPSLVRTVFGSHGPMFKDDDERQWKAAETRLRNALEDFGHGVAGSYRNRLFSSDALEGLRFIDLVGERFDAVVMNPPFGDRITSTESSLARSYGDGKLDLYHYFYIRAEHLLTDLGRVGAITPRTALYQSRYEDLRNQWLRSTSSPLFITELGLGVLDDATVRPSLVVIGRNSGRHTFYCNLKHSQDPECDFLQNIASYRDGFIPRRCTVQDISRFLSMPGKRISLWAPDAVLDRYNSEDTLEPAYGKVTEGLTCEDDARFIRCWWEVIRGPKGYWAPFGKYDSRSTFVPDFSMVINWSASAYKSLGMLGNRRANEGHYNKPGYAFTRSCEVGMAATTLPAGVVFAGVARYFIPNRPIDFGLLSYLNTRMCEALHVILTPDRDRISGTLRKLPIIIDEESIEEIAPLGEKVWNMKEGWLRSVDETYRNYFDLLAPVLKCGGAASRAQECLSLKARVEEIEKDIESKVEKKSSFDDIDIEVLREEVEERAGERDLVCWNANLGTGRQWAANVISVAVGVIFGRWDIRCIIGTRSPEPSVDPFGPLPDLPPGMLLRSDGHMAMGINDLPAAYPFQPSFAGILVGPGLSSDTLPSKIREVFALICDSNESGVNQDDLEDEICNLLGVSSIDQYINSPSGFFLDHVRQYTKCKRLAPIYWPLSTVSGGYTLWLYYPALTDQTLYTAANDFVGAKLERQVEPALRALRQKTGRSRDEEGELEDLQTLHDELRRLRDDLLELAPAWKPNHDDGVQITAAPLWRLFRHRPWQTVLRDTWEKLEAGDYDWAHLAMAYWPERVREKCRTDRSLAIAHDLEHLYEPPPEAPAKVKGGRGRKKKG